MGRRVSIGEPDPAGRGANPGLDPILAGPCWVDGVTRAPVGAAGEGGRVTGLVAPIAGEGVWRVGAGAGEALGLVAPGVLAGATAPAVGARGAGRSEVVLDDGFTAGAGRTAFRAAVARAATSTSTALKFDLTSTPILRSSATSFSAGRPASFATW